MNRVRHGLGEIFLSLDYCGSYRALRQAAYSTYYSPGVLGEPPSDAVLRATLTRMKKQGLLARSGKVWRVTNAGKIYFEKKLLRRKYPETASELVKNMIIAFDIPERYSQKRLWLRMELKVLGFEMIQKSVWLGPAPLPKVFVQELHTRKLLPYLKFFKAREEEII